MHCARCPATHRRRLSGSTPPKTVRRILIGLVLAAGLPLIGSPSPTPDGHTRARHGMVVAESRLAAEAGANVLREGGNAIDAAVATAFALAVVHPAAGNIGGGGFLVYRAHNGDAVAYDFRETAPARATPHMFIRDGEYNWQLHHRSHLSVGVPGTVAGLHLAWSDQGRLPWKRLVEPAIVLATRGLVVTEDLAQSLSNALPKLASSPAAVAQFTRKGQPYSAGDTLKQPDLAHTLQLIAELGPAGFYEGEVADRIALDMEAHGGWITKSDLKAYTPKRRAPVRGSYRGFELLSMPPPSSGGIVLIQMLNVLEGFDLPDGRAGSPATAHRMVEAMRRGFADRARYLGDPDWNPDMPTALLTSKSHADALRDTIQPERASVSSTNSFAWPSESTETTHVSVVDAARNAVALTYTLEESYGAGIVAPGTGFLLNNEMGDFNPVPGLTSTNGLIGTPPNLTAPRKRMLSSMTPTVVAKDGRLFLVLGSPGGRTIINTVLQIVVNVVDHRMALPDAVAARRFHHQWLPDQILFERGAFAPETVARLIEWGHSVRENPNAQGVVAAIQFDPVQDWLEGAADPRAPDAAAVGW